MLVSTYRAKWHTKLVLLIARILITERVSERTNEWTKEESFKYTEDLAFALYYYSYSTSSSAYYYYLTCRYLLGKFKEERSERIFIKIPLHKFWIFHNDHYFDRKQQCKQHLHYLPHSNPLFFTRKRISFLISLHFSVCS